MEFEHKLLREIDVGESNGENLLLIRRNVPCLEHPRSLPLWLQLSIHETPPNRPLVLAPFDANVLAVILVLVHHQRARDAAVHPLL